MVVIQSNLFYFPYLDNAIFQPSKIKDNNDIFLDLPSDVVATNGTLPFSSDFKL